MVTAKELLSLVAEAEGGFKVGDMVQFVKGHEQEGMVGQISNIQPSGNYDVMVGKSIRVDVKPEEIEAAPNAAQTGEGKKK